MFRCCPWQKRTRTYFCDLLGPFRLPSFCRRTFRAYQNMDQVRQALPLCGHKWGQSPHRRNGGSQKSTLGHGGKEQRRTGTAQACRARASAPDAVLDLLQIRSLASLVPRQFTQGHGKTSALPHPFKFANFRVRRALSRHSATHILDVASLYACKVLARLRFSGSPMRAKSSRCLQGL